MNSLCVLYNNPKQIKLLRINSNTEFIYHLMSSNKVVYFFCKLSKQSLITNLVLLQDHYHQHYNEQNHSSTLASAMNNCCKTSKYLNRNSKMTSKKSLTKIMMTKPIRRNTRTAELIIDNQ